MRRSSSRTPTLVLSGIAIGALVLGACSSDEEPAAAPTPTPVETPDTVVVGSANFAENKLVAEVYALVLENAGIKVNRDYSQGLRQDYLPSIDEGEIDVFPEYIGTLAEAINRVENGEDAPQVASGNPEATTEALRELLEPYDAVVTDPARAHNNAAFAVRAQYAKKHDLQTISDLKTVNNKMVLGGPKACADSDFCLVGLEDDYKLKFKNVKKTDFGGYKTLNALQNGRIDVGVVLATDPAVDERNFVVLEDDKELQVAGNITALMPAESASEEMIALLESVNEVLTTKELRGLNGQVSVKGFPVDYSAAKWAADQGLIPKNQVPKKPKPTPPPSPTPTPEPEPEPEPETEPAAAPPSSSFNRNVGEPSSAAVSQNWPGLAQCESGGDPTIVSSNGLYHGLYQFSVPTWQAMGGAGAASTAIADEQTYRAQILWDQAGPGQWPVCGANL